MYLCFISSLLSLLVWLERVERVWVSILVSLALALRPGR